MRRSLSPGAALTAFRTAMDVDVTDVLSAVRVPTLILPRPSEPGPGHYMAERIRGAQLVELPLFGGVYTWTDDAAHRATIEASQRFTEGLDRPDQRGMTRFKVGFETEAARSLHLSAGFRPQAALQNFVRATGES